MHLISKYSKELQRLDVLLDRTYDQTNEMFTTESVWQICNPSSFPTFLKIIIVEFQRKSDCKVNVLFLDFWFPDTFELLRNWAGGKKASIS